MQDYDSKDIKSVLQYICDHYGIAMFQTQGKGLAYVKDLAPKLTKELNLLKALDETGVLQELTRASSENEKEQKRLLEFTRQKLVNERALDEAYAVSFLQMLSEVFGWKYLTFQADHRKVQTNPPRPKAQPTQTKKVAADTVYNHPPLNGPNQAKPKRKPTRKAPFALLLLLVAVAAVLALLAFAIVMMLNKKDAPPLPSQAEMDAPQSAIRQPTVQSEPPAQSEPQSAAPVQQVEEWGRQEILISPKGNGKAKLTLRQMYQGSWTTLFECDAMIGRNGTTGTPREGDGKTPEGTFPVLFCYGLQRPETEIPFLQLSPGSVWVDDSKSDYYNCLTTREQAGSASYEDTYSQFSRGFYSYNIFFANNGDGRTPGLATPGNGSVRVLEGYKKKLEPTNGDIKISAQNMQTLLSYLDSKYDPSVTVLSQ